VTSKSNAVMKTFKCRCVHIVWCAWGWQSKGREVNYVRRNGLRAGLGRSAALEIAACHPFHRKGRKISAAVMPKVALKACLH